MSTKPLLLLLSFLTFAAPAAQAAAADAPREVRAVLIQHNGRVKTFDAFSRQTLRLISGKESWKRKPAAAVLWGVLLDRPSAENLEWIRLDLPELKERLGIRDERHTFTLKELGPGLNTVIDLAMSAKAKRDRDERPSAVEQKAEQLLGRMRTVSDLVSGAAFTVVPPAKDSGSQAWHSAFDPHEPSAKAFGAVLKACHNGSPVQSCVETAAKWNASARAASRQAADAKVEAELFYLSFHPFQWAWMLYLSGFLILAFAGPLNLRRIGMACVVSAWVFHTLGLGLRVFVLGRPPVSNMYESMIFMNWALMLFAFVLGAVRRTSAPLTAGAVISALIEIYANLLPIDPSMDVLVPVLRSNYWLTVHVLTVVASYGAFGLALALGHRHLVMDRVLGRWTEKDRDASARLTLRIIEFGVILIGTGTVLGGVWANESWGRFWGWDPKETWALITLLGYLAIVHLRYFKKIGPFGLAVSTIIGFQLVLFTWYGVNFVLGRGLHSYGSGSGGMNWILYYLAAQTVFLIFIFLRKK